MEQSQSSENNEVALSQIQEMYKKFASECPSGNLHLHEFKRIFGITCDSSAEESAYMDNLFRLFDTNHVSIMTAQVKGSDSEGSKFDLGYSVSRLARHDI